MQLVISCDYLVSPAFCTPEELDICVESLIAVKRELARPNNTVTIEENALLKLESIGQYPCARIFNHNIGDGFDSAYSGRDIARTVNNILSMRLDESCCVPLCLAEWREREISPLIKGCLPERSSDLEDLVEGISLASYVYGRNFSMLHHPLSPDVSSIKVAGEISALEPEPADLFPIKFDGVVSVFSDFLQYSAALGGFSLYEAAVTDEEFKAAIFSGALSVLKSVGLDTMISWDQLSFGADFIDTLHAHQCGPKGRFSGTAYDVICHAVAGAKKYEVNPFYEDVGKKIQKTSNGNSAWRTHITKGNPALRLMYWSSGGSVQLANIGNKKELLIFPYHES